MKRLLLALGAALLLACSPQATAPVVTPPGVDVVEAAGSRLASPGASVGALHGAAASPSEAPAPIVAQQEASLCPDTMPTKHPEQSILRSETAMVREWTATTRVYRMPNLSKRVVTGIAGINYYNRDLHIWAEPAPTLVASDDPAYECMVEYAPYRAYFSANGARRFYPDRDNLERWVEIPASRFAGGRTFTREGTSTEYRHVSPSGHTAILRFDKQAVVYDVLFESEPASNTLLFDYTAHGMTDEEVAALFVRNEQRDAADVRQPVQTQVANGLITVRFNTNAEYPLLVDPTTVTPAIGASECDGSEDDSANNPSITNTVLQALEDDAVIALCWTVNVPQGATIDSAYLNIWPTSGVNDEPLHILCAEDVDDADVFAAVENDMLDRLANCTTATDTWDDTDLGAGGGDKEVQWGAAAVGGTGGSDIGPIIQEIVDRAGWVSGNNLALLIDATDNGRDLDARSWDGNSANAAVLTVTYSEAAAADTGSNFWQWVI